MTPFIASIIWVSAVTIAIIVDIFLAKDRISGNTWSEVTRFWAEKNIIIPWICGILCGHWFHGFKEGSGFESHKMWILIGLTIPVLGLGILVHNLVNPFPNWLLMIVLQLGIIAGVFLWRV